MNKAEPLFLGKSYKNLIYKYLQLKNQHSIRILYTRERSYNLLNPGVGADHALSGRFPYPLPLDLYRLVDTLTVCAQ